MNFSRTTLGVGTTLGALLCGGSIAAVPLSPSTPPSYVAPLLERPTAPSATCGWCYQEPCEPQEHEFVPSLLFDGPDRSYGEKTHSCSEGWCSEAHPESHLCNSEQDGDFVLEASRWSEIWEATKVDDPSALAKLMEIDGGSIFVNQARKALQMRDCASRIILSIPLSEVQLAELLDL